MALDHEVAERAVRHGTSAHLLDDPEFLSGITMLGKDVVQPYDWSSYGASLIHPFAGPRVSIICGACSAPSKGPAIYAVFHGRPQDWSVVQCQRCFTPNAVPIVMMSGEQAARERAADEEAQTAFADKITRLQKSVAALEGSAEDRSKRRWRRR